MNTAGIEMGSDQGWLGVSWRWWSIIPFVFFTVCVLLAISAHIEIKRLQVAIAQDHYAHTDVDKPHAQLIHRDEDVSNLTVTRCLWIISAILSLLIALRLFFKHLLLAKEKSSIEVDHDFKAASIQVLEMPDDLQDKD